MLNISTLQYIVPEKYEKITLFNKFRVGKHDKKRYDKKRVPLPEHSLIIIFCFVSFFYLMLQP